MKKMRKLLSLALALILLLSLSVPAFADGGKNLGYSYYFNIGDSIARACGLDPSEGQRKFYYNDVWNNVDGGHNQEGSFPLDVARAIGKEAADANFQYMGMRTVEAYYGLGGCVDPKTYDNYYDMDFAWHLDGGDEVNPGSIKDNRAAFQNAAGAADLITLQLGMNDVFYSAAARSGLDKDGLSMDEKVALLGDMVKYMWEGYNDFLKYYPKIVDRILQLNDNDVTIMLVGYFNPAANSGLTEDIWLPVGDALTAITGLMNLYVKNLASKIPQAVFVDISATQTPISSGDKPVIEGFRENSTLNTHPTPAGYQYIARQIINALPAREKPNYPPTYVQLNLGTSFKVNKVYLDSTSFSFRQNGYDLVVPSISALHKTVTVIGSQDGKTLVYVYGLSYSLRNGYTTYRISSTDNAAQTVSNVLSGTFSIGSTILNAIGSLFK